MSSFLKKWQAVIVMLVAVCAIVWGSSVVIWAQTIKVTEGNKPDCWDGSSVEVPSGQVVVNGISYYEIGNAAQLAYIAQNGGEWFANNYILTNDILLNEEELVCDVVGNLKIDPSGLNVWQPIDGFSGTFDGNGHSISGLYVKSDRTAGLFANVTGMVSNLTLQNIYVEGGQNVGGIAGCATNVVGCSVYGSVVGSGNVGGIVGECANSISDCTNYANVFSYGDNVGGVAGKALVVDKCTNYGYIFGDTNNTGGVIGYLGVRCNSCYNYGKIIGRADNTGGIAGYFYTGSMSECVNYSDVSSAGSFAGGVAGRIDHTGSIQHCGNLGDVSGAYYVGGIVGYTPDITLPEGTPEVMIMYHISVINECYNAGDVSGADYAGGIVAYSDDCNVVKSYNIGNVTGSSYIGAVIGSCCQLIGAHRGAVRNCYYLQNDTINCGVTAFGNEFSDQPGVAEAKVTEFFPICVNAGSDPGYSFLGYAYIVDFVDRLYVNVLNRKADTQGKLNWVVTLKNGTNNGASLAKIFVLGEEFALRNLSDEEYVKVLYRTFFGREADAGGMDNWLIHLQSGYSREYVLSKFVNLDEFTELCKMYGIERGLMFENGSVASLGIQDFVKRLYESALGREMDSDGFYNWVCAIASKNVTADEVAMNFFGSEEYTLRDTNSEVFVRDLYCVFMDREADAEGLDYWVSCIDNYGMTRDWVAEQFAKSYEFYLIMQKYGVI